MMTADQATTHFKGPILLPHPKMDGWPAQMGVPAKLWAFRCTTKGHESSWMLQCNQGGHTLYFPTWAPSWEGIYKRVNAQHAFVGNTYGIEVFKKEIFGLPLVKGGIKLSGVGDWRRRSILNAVYGTRDPKEFIEITGGERYNWDKQLWEMNNGDKSRFLYKNSKWAKIEAKQIAEYQATIDKYNKKPPAIQYVFEI